MTTLDKDCQSVLDKMTNISDLDQQFRDEITEQFPSGQDVRDFFESHPTTVFYRKGISLWLDDMTVEFYIAVNKNLTENMKCYSSVNTSINPFSFREQLNEWSEERFDDECEKGTHMHLTEDLQFHQDNTAGLDNWVARQLVAFLEWFSKERRFCQYCMKGITRGRICSTCIRHKSRFACSFCAESYGEKGYGPQRRSHHSCYLTDKGLDIPY